MPVGLHLLTGEVLDILIFYLGRMNRSKRGIALRERKRDSGKERTKGSIGMNDVIGIAWFKDEATYRRALAIFTDPQNMPASFEDWKSLVGRQCELINQG